jgi:glycosyltransferase involved in cell wall biosynthesis
VPTPPRLLYVITLAEVGGAQTYISNLLPAVTEAFDVSVAAHGDGPLRAACVEAGVRFIQLRHVRRPLSPLRDVLGLIELTKLFRRLHPNIVHLNSSKVGVLGRLAARLAGVPVCIFTVHGWAFKASDGFAAFVYRLLDRATRPLTTAIVCVSETERNVGLAARTCTAAQAVVIRNAVAVPARRRRELAGTRPLRLISVGRLAEPKDFSTLVSAVGLLPRGGVELQILGDGPQRTTIEQQIRRLGLENAVVLVGTVDDVPERLIEADIFVLSSRSEGMPMSILEAMAAGLPVVASDVGGIREMIASDEAQFLVRPGDAGALAEALTQLLSDSRLRESVGARNRVRAEDEFSFARFQEEHLALYNALLSTRQ